MTFEIVAVTTLGFLLALVVLFSVESLAKRNGEWVRDLLLAYQVGDRLWTQERWRRKGNQAVPDEELTFEVVRPSITLR